MIEEALRFQPLGLVPDAMIARQLGLDRRKVGHWRQEWGIPAYRPPRRRLVPKQAPEVLQAVHDAVGRIVVRPTREIHSIVCGYGFPVSQRSVNRALVILLLLGKIRRICEGAPRDWGYLRCKDEG